MSDKPYTVHIIVDSEFGERLVKLPIEEPVWVIDSTVNRSVVHRLFAQRPAPSHLTGITIFKPGGVMPEEELLSVLYMVDLHHGEYSANPPYSTVIVYGTSLTTVVARAFAEIGLTGLRSTLDGFIAERAHTGNPAHYGFGL